MQSIKRYFRTLINARIAICNQFGDEIEFIPLWFIVALVIEITYFFQIIFNWRF